MSKMWPRIRTALMKGLFIRGEDILIKFYSEDVSKLEKILGQSLPWKNFH